MGIMDNYAIQILEKEINLLEKCLSDWELNKYPEVKKERELKLSQLKFAMIAILLKILK
jgi:hypothetical protein